MPNKLLFIEANTSGTGMLALRKALALGLQPLFFTHNPQRYMGLEQTGCPVVVCDTNNFAALQAAIDRCVSRGEIAGIMTTSDFYLETVAILTTQYSLPGNPLEAISRARNKATMRQHLQQGTLHQPCFALVRTVDEVDRALNTTGLPCVVKPADDSGSNNVLCCSTRAQARAQVSNILATRVNVRGQPAARVALLEEYIDAPEFSVEMFTLNGETTCIGLTQKTLTGFPFFVELRHLFPISLPESQMQQIAETVQQALTLIGMQQGATHTEIKWTAQGCSLIEINPRLAGGMIPELIQQVTGIDLLEQQIRSAVGLPVSLQGRAEGVAGIQFLTAERTGILRSIEGIDAVASMPDVVAVKAIALAGMSVQPPENAYHRLGYVIVHSSNAELAANHLQDAINHVQIHID